GSDGIRLLKFGDRLHVLYEATAGGRPGNFDEFPLSEHGLKVRLSIDAETKGKAETQRRRRLIRVLAVWCVTDAEGLNRDIDSLKAQHRAQCGDGGFPDICSEDESRGD
ncbi:hypothetical protein chiPu_0029372, partial [Chiloscyllium punctatum]|nr:hypothetical protein [Chiloscyllium punctatum]